MPYPAYEAHFGLSESPFRIVPDVDSYVDSKKARAAIATLSGGLDADDEFIALTGDVGVGKTMVARRLLAELDPLRFAVAEVIGARLELGDVLDNVATAFGLAAPDSPEAPLARLRDARQRDGREAVLVVDEAEDLGAETLRCLDELVSIRLDDRGAFHVCLVGSNLPTGLLELRRRGKALPMGVVCDLASLDAEDMRAYVLRRLQRAGWSGRPAFDGASTQEIHACSRGNPARVNLLCGRLLLHLSMTRSHDDVRVELVRAIDAQLKAEVSGEPNPELARLDAEPGSDDDPSFLASGAGSATAPAWPPDSSSAPDRTQRPRVAVGNEIDAMFARAPAPRRVPAADVAGRGRQPVPGVEVESSPDGAMTFADGMVGLFKASRGHELALAERPSSRPRGRAVGWWRRAGSRFVVPSALVLGGVGLGGAIAWYVAMKDQSTFARTPVAAPVVVAAAPALASTSASTAERGQQSLLQQAEATLDAAPARAGAGVVAVAPRGSPPSLARPAATPARLAAPGARQGARRSPPGGVAVTSAAPGACSQELLSLGLCVAAPARPQALPAPRGVAAGDSGEPPPRAAASRHCASAEVALGLCPTP